MSTGKLRVAINGFGRIGRGFVRVLAKRPELLSQVEIVAINDLGDVANLAYLLKYDSAHGQFPMPVEAQGGALVVNGMPIQVLAERDPAKLPWGTMAVDVVVESTGIFETYEKASAHSTAGAKRVVISAPAKGDSKDGAMVLMGVNEFALEKCKVSSNASCTTNAISPIIAIMKETIGIEKALLNTVHAYTATQGLVDSPGGKDMRRGRAAAQNIVPASTGAASALGKIVPEVNGIFDGIALRVPVVDGSIADVTFVSKRSTTVEEVNKLLSDAAADERWKQIYTVSSEPLVSSDIVGNLHASIADLTSTMVVGGNLVKILAWYDNEMGYCNTLMEHVIKAGRIG